jgi:hypothetical protein
VGSGVGQYSTSSLSPKSGSLMLPMRLVDFDPKETLAVARLS